MAQEPLRLSRSGAVDPARLLPPQPVGPADVKAQRYVGKFFHRRLLGGIIAAEVEGNHGIYAVYIDAGATPAIASCSCFIGARGGCHHVRALAQTFLDAPESFRKTPVRRWSRAPGRSSSRGRRSVVSAPTRISPLDGKEVDGSGFLAVIDRFVADCQRGAYYEPERVTAGWERLRGGFRPHIEAFDLLDELLRRADRLQRAGEHAVAVAAFEKLFSIVWGDARQRFGVPDVSGWLRTDLRQAFASYLSSLGAVCRPEEYVRRARKWVAWTHPDLLVEVSTPEQLAVLETDLQRELGATDDPTGHMPYSLSLLRHIYEHQGRIDESMELCRRWRHRYPALRAPLMDQAESANDWRQLEALAREALSEGRMRATGSHDQARSRLERRLSLALERQGKLAEALLHAEAAFRWWPGLEGYRVACGLAERLSRERRARSLGEISSFLRARMLADGSYPDSRRTSPEAVLLARILLAEGRHADAYGLAVAARGATRIALLGIVGSHYLALDDEGSEQVEALSRAAECHRHLVQLFVDARGRDNYAMAAAYAASLRDIRERQGRAGEFDRWYAELMDNHARYRALKEEFRRRLGPEPSSSATPSSGAGSEPPPRRR